MSQKIESLPIHSCSDHADESLISEEILHHLPYAVFSIALGLILLSFLDVFTISAEAAVAKKSAHRLFHSFHFLHIIFAMTGSIISFSRFSSRILLGSILSLFSSVIFCTLSDVILPYLSGYVLNVPMKLHFCLVSELHNILPFILVGLLNGIIMSRHKTNLMQLYSLGSHFIHILVSSLASLFYLVSQGMHNWYPKMGIIFLLQIVAVVIPCTLADVVVPLFFARLSRKNEKYKAREYQEVL